MSNTPKLRFPEFKGEWEEKKLDSLSLINPKPGDLPEVFSYIDLESVKNGVLLQEKIIKKEEAPSRAQRLLEEKDILFQTVRPYQRNNYFFNSKSPTVASTGYAQFRVNKNNYPSFLYQYLYTNNFVKNVLDRCSGTSFPAISTNDLLEICLHIPSLVEQQKIADFLSNVDSIIIAETKILNSLQKKKKALMQKLFTQQLRFKSNDGTDFPEWEDSTLEKECDYVDYRGKTPKKVSTGIFLVTAKNIKLGYIDYECSKEYIAENDYNEVMHRGKVKLGDVLITTEAPCGNVAQIDNENVALAQRVIKYSSKGRLNNTFLKYYFLSDLFRTIINEKATGSTVKGIKGSVLHKQKVIVPSLEEQQKIADCLSNLDSLIQNQQKVVTTWQQRKKALLQQMFI
jgi:type I restriction enzyme S subunit